MGWYVRDQFTCRESLIPSSLEDEVFNFDQFTQSGEGIDTVPDSNHAPEAATFATEFDSFPAAQEHESDTSRQRRDEESDNAASENSTKSVHCIIRIVNLNIKNVQCFRGAKERNVCHSRKVELQLVISLLFLCSYSDLHAKMPGRI
jgi:hypothetical protein